MSITRRTDIEAVFRGMARAGVNAAQAASAMQDVMKAMRTTLEIEGDKLAGVHRWHYETPDARDRRTQIRKIRFYK